MYPQLQIVIDQITPAQPLLKLTGKALKAHQLSSTNRREVLDFLAIRPVHTVVMTSLINDNGLENSLNRGKFYGYKNAEGTLEGVALIGHTTLVEARSEEALKALALAARASDVPLHLIMSDGNTAGSFWKYLGNSHNAPRLTCTELLFEIKYPFPIQKCDHDIRQAVPEELEQVAAAQAEIAFRECGVDPMEKDREGFIKRVSRRLGQGRIFVVVENEKLLFKADIIAETSDIIYLEGIYVAPGYRGRGMGPRCLSKLSADLLKRAPNISLLSNITFTGSHRSYLKAGFRQTGACVTLFV